MSQVKRCMGFVYSLKDQDFKQGNSHQTGFDSREQTGGIYPPESFCNEILKRCKKTRLSDLQIENEQTLVVVGDICLGLSAKSPLESQQDALY